MNWNLLGHEWAVGLLREKLTREEIRHAFLFCGPKGVGRRTLALRLSQALNCVKPPAAGDFCGECRACVLIEAMQHPDLAVVESEQEGSILRVDQIRDLQRSLNLYPYEARYRIALLLRFEEANANAMNALLKTLEEPPPQVVLMLTAASPEQLLPTIVSRCEILRLRSTPLDKVEVGLQELFGVDPERARMLAHVSAGRSGYALRLYQEPNLMQQRRTLLEDLSRLLEANRLDRFSYVEPLTKDKDSLRFTLLIWHSFWRDVFVQATGASAPVTNLDFRTEIASAAEKFSLDKSFRIASALERTINLLDSNINARLALEVLMLDMPHG